MSQVPGTVPDERSEVNTGQDEFSIANREVHQEGLRGGMPESKESEVGSQQRNQEAPHDPRRHQGADHHAGDANQQGGQNQHQRHEGGRQDGQLRGEHGNQNRNWRQGGGVQSGQPQFQERSINDDTMARGYGRAPHQQLGGGGRYIPYGGVNMPNHSEQFGGHPQANGDTRVEDILRNGVTGSRSQPVYTQPQVWNQLMAPITNVRPTTAQNYFSGFNTQQEAGGVWDQAMSQITSNPTSANQGTGFNHNILSRELFDQLQMALSIQMGLNGPQQVKENALHNVLTSPAARGDMKQILQSRAGIYGDELDPKWFKHKADVGGKASTLRQKNQARTQLAGAPLLVAQLGALELRKKLLQGDNNALQDLRLGSQITVMEMLKILGKLPPISALRLCNRQFGD